MAVKDFVVQGFGCGHHHTPKKRPRRRFSRAASISNHAKRDSRLAAGGFLLGNAGGFTRPAAQIIKLGAADTATAQHFDLGDIGRVKREDALDAFAIGNFANGEVRIDPVILARNAHAFKGLEALKFFQFILPDSKVKLTLTYKPEKQKLYFSYQGDKGKYSSGRIVFG